MRLFEPGTLQYITTLPRPPACGKQHPSKLGLGGKGATAEAAAPAMPPVYPDCVCVSLSKAGGECARVIYSDHSFCSWDLTDVKVGLRAPL